MNFFKLSREDPLVKRLKSAYNLSLQIVEKIRDIGKKMDVEIYLYGSTARGEDAEDSDWDILILGDLQRNEITEEFRKLRKLLNKEIKLLLYKKAEWSIVAKKDPAFYERVEKDKIRLV
jgi:predicted nucleotidyltransferase